MKLLGALVVAIATTAASPSFAAAVTNTVDFSTIGFSDGATVDLLSGSGTDFHFTTQDNFGSSSLTVATNVKYHAAADYSGGPALIGATDPGIFQLVIDAQPGRVFTKLTFGFGAFPNTTQDGDWLAADETYANSFGFGTLTVDGTSGSPLAFSGLNTPSFLLQFDPGQNVGLRYVTYTEATPIPGTLLLLGTALAGMFVLGRRKRAIG